MKDIDNLAVWGLAYKTDPSATKSYKGAGGFSGTAIASLYCVQRATEIFGPLGHGWGFEIVDEQLIPGGPLISKEGEHLGCNEQTHSIRIAAWAKHEGRELKSIGIGMTPHITQNKYGITTDHEVQKKSLTDAIKGALKLWGFSADVYMGDHDDPEYVKHVANLMAMDKADDKVAEVIKQDSEYKTWQETTLRLISEAVSVSMIEGLYKAGVLKAKRKGDDDYIKQMVTACSARKADLVAKQQEKQEEVA
jgi:hypothetical protein